MTRRDPFEGLDRVDRVDEVLDENPSLVVFGGVVCCQVCGAQVTSLAAVGVAEERVRVHIAGHEGGTA